MAFPETRYRGVSSVSFFVVHNHPDQGPKLHRHPYDETFTNLGPGSARLVCIHASPSMETEWVPQPPDTAGATNTSEPSLS